MTKVTKNPGRVLAGKKLQELNKSHKENLKKKIEELETRLESTSKEPEISTSKDLETTTSKQLEPATYKLAAGVFMLISIAAIGYTSISLKPLPLKNHLIHRNAGKANRADLNKIFLAINK